MVLLSGNDMKRGDLIRMIKQDANLPGKNDGKDFFSRIQLLHVSLLIKKLLGLTDAK